MPSPTMHGRPLKQWGAVFMVAGIILFVVGLGQQSGGSRPEAGPSLPGAIMLAEAKGDISNVLKGIYTALDEGRAPAATTFLTQPLPRNLEGYLDYICQPFNYRAHYVASVVQRSDTVFVAQVRTLFKPFKEKAYLMQFVMAPRGTFRLNRVDDDQCKPESEAAKETVRQFVFAVRAEKWDVASRYASP